ncbi:von Willebrand factor type A domain-containing protein [Glomus cerebriforme]|uniref:von Willebrand factor type A domain-containing protein n=1 Tax=Glomus cerebriforme TaxID=658196 RepID=A0A397TMD9_9GLOM|nr:von Willebrand factor type A domain-containing protein [Glomus cerebriforme]
MQIYGLIYVIKEKETSIPLQNVVVEANVVDMITEVTISQTYKNVEKTPIEALYKFPIHEAAAVCGFEAEIDGQRKVKGVVKEAKKAAEEYTKAIEEGHGAYLLESESADVFQCSVGNITSGQTIVIKITYVSELKHDSESEKIRFVLPTHIAPRYGFSSSSSNDGKILKADAVSYSNKADFYLDLTITCRMTSIIQNIESPSHKISTEMYIDENPKISKITLAEQITYLEKDFILVIKSKDLDQPRAFVEYNPETQTNCLMLTLVPKFALNTTISELIFVVDRSGSMSVKPMKKAAQALELLLRSIPEDCFFNIISFGSRYDSLFPESQLYSESSLSKALNLAQTMTSNYGGTEIFTALKWAFENSRNDMPTSIFLITDGEVWNVDQVVELVRKNEERKKGDLRLFSLGIGDAVSHHLVESVARTGKGYAQFVTNDERMDKKVIGMLKNALKPPIKDYKITWIDNDILESIEESTKEKEPEVIQDKPTISFMSNNTEPPSPPPSNIFTDIKVQQAPYFIPSIYPGVRFIVYCILEKNIKPCKVITLKATSQDGPMKLDIPLDPITLQGSKIHRLAARKLIQDLNDEKSFLHNHPKNAGKHIPASLVKEYIIKLGKTFNLASKHTSFIAIDERTIEPNEVIIKARKRNVHQRQSYVSADAPAAATSFASYDQIVSPVSMNWNSRSMSNFSGLFSSKISSKSKRAATRQPVMMDMSLNMNVKPQEINKPKFNHKESHIENLFEFLGLQSFDGKFLPNKSFYEFFYINDLNDLKQEVEKEVGKIKAIEEILSTYISMNYLEIIMFENFKDECEMCYEKAEKALKKMVENEEKRKIIFEKAKEWIQNWVNEKQ